MDFIANIWFGLTVCLVCTTMAVLSQTSTADNYDDNGYDSISFRDRDPGSCHALQVHYCYGERFPYLFTAPHNRLEHQPYFRLRHPSFFKQSERFRYLPSCWLTLQPMLCALRFPKCSGRDGVKQVLARSICDRAMSACQLVKENIPPFLSNCSDPFLFGQTDRDMEFANEMMNLSFNSTDGLCPIPLSRTNNPARFYGGLKGCGVQCEDPFLSPEETHAFHITVITLAIVTVILNAFGFASIIVKLRMVHSATFNPDSCAMYMSLSFMISSCGYLIQITPELRTMVTCTDDGGRQLLGGFNEWSVRHSLCLLSFLLTYIFTSSGLVWFGHLMFACFLDFQKIINSHRKTKITTFPLARSSFVFFHGTAWLLPLVPAIAMVLLSSVQGNSLLGVCWIVPRYKAAFVVAPFTLVLLVASGFTGLYWLNLRKSQLDQFGTLKTQRSVLRRLRLVGCLCLAILVLFFLQLAGILCVVYNERIWSGRLLEYAQCQIKSMTSEAPFDCTASLKAVRKSYLGAFYAMVVPYFVTGIAISAWMWNAANLNRWKWLVCGGKLSNMQIYRPGSTFHDDHELKATYGEYTENDQMLQVDPILKRVCSGPRYMVQPSVITEDVETDFDTLRFKRDSIIPGEKINSVGEFDHFNKLENWQERARECRLSRRKSDLGTGQLAVGAGFRISGSHQSHHNLQEHRVPSSKSINRTSSHGSALHHATTKKPTMLKSTSSSEFIEF